MLSVSVDKELCGVIVIIVCPSHSTHLFLATYAVIHCLVAGVWRAAAAQSSCDEEEEARLRLSPTLNLRSPDGNVGRLEICLGGAWGTFTLETQLDFWSEKNVQVACRELGFSGGLNSIPPSQ